MSVRLCIFGGRNLYPSAMDIQLGLEPVWDAWGVGGIDEVVCGMATGADTAGRKWADAHGIPVKPFRADWAKHGKAAGPIRNEEMAQYCTHGLGFWDKQSRGTANMASLLALYGKPCRLFEL